VCLVSLFLFFYVILKRIFNIPTCGTHRKNASRYRRLAVGQWRYFSSCVSRKVRSLPQRISGENPRRRNFIIRSTRAHNLSRSTGRIYVFAISAFWKSAAYRASSSPSFLFSFSSVALYLLPGRRAAKSRLVLAIAAREE
jgi:hypothetical protein